MKSLVKVLVAICACITFGNVQAQQKHTKLSGKINDHTGTPLKAASVALFNKYGNDSSLVKTTLTETNGTFAFEQIKPGTYCLQVSAAGYTTYSTEAVTIDSLAPTISIPSITLRKSQQRLKEVVITAARPMVEQKTDRTVVNVESMISNTGSNALEVLEKAPGVLVDQNGSISLKGKSGVMVLIDNRPTYLSSAELAAYLKSLPSESLDQIELIPNPPARYDAAGNAGIINIKTKKSKIKGINGTLSTSVTKGVYWRNNENINLNYRNNKFNVFGTAGFNIYNGWRRLDITRTNYKADQTVNSYFTQTSYFNPESNSFNLKAGADFYASDKTTFGMVLTATRSKNEETTPVSSELFNSSRLIDSMVLTDNNQASDFNKRGLNLNYSHNFDSAGTSLSFDGDYVRYNSATDQAFLNSTFLSDNTLKYRENLSSNLPSVINIYSAKADYNLSKGKAKWGAGLKSSYVSTDNAANYFSLVNNTALADLEKTNHFKFSENINAAYINYNQDFKRLSIQSGLRFENTSGKGHQLGNAAKRDSSFSNNYNSLFPTLFASYKLDSAGKNTLNFSYGRRIDRPYYQDLNPFIFMINKFTYFAGNPFLRPQYSDNLNLSYNFNNMLTLTAVYSYGNNVFNEVIEQKNNVFISRTGNIGKRINAGFSLNATLKKGKWLTSNIYTEAINNSFKGTLPSGQFSASSTYWSISPNNQFSFGKDWGAELSGYYTTRATYGQFKIASRWLVNAGLQKKILAKKGTIKLSAQDIFRSFEPRGNIFNISNTDATFHNYLDRRAFSASFTYSFNKGTTNARKRNTGGGAGSEQDRVKN